MRDILILLIFTSLNLCAALPPRVQDKIDAQREEQNSQYKEQSPVVVEVKVITVDSARGFFDSNYLHVHLEVEVIKTIKNKNNKSIPKELTFKYKNFSPIDGWVGPKWFDLMIPEKEKTYKLYLDDNFTFNARDESIEEVNND